MILTVTPSHHPCVPPLAFMRVMSALSALPLKPGVKVSLKWKPSGIITMVVRSPPNGESRSVRFFGLGGLLYYVGDPPYRITPHQLIRLEPHRRIYPEDDQAVLRLFLDIR